MPSSRRSESRSKAGPVLEAVLQIMEQGPQPIRGTKKIPNSADRFEADHQAGYESYEDQRVNGRCSQVNMHNAASPKMKDELDNRRSISKPKAPSVMLAKTNVYYDPRCRACQKLKQAEAKRRDKPKRNTEKKRKVVKKARVTKKRTQRKAKSSFRLAKFTTNKGRRYAVGANPGTLDDSDMTKTDHKTDGESSPTSPSSLLLYRRLNPSRTSKTVSANGSISDVISQYPDTSVNSLSSYNSNMSLDHEPMVDN